jgi:cytochrome c5
MSRKMLLLALLMVAVLAPISGRTEPLTTLKSVTVDLPDSGRMFPGPGSDAINNNCLACHSAGMVLNQPVLPKSAWQAEVTKMINTYKAPVSEEDAAAIVDYLTRAKGAQ